MAGHTMQLSLALTLILMVICGRTDSAVICDSLACVTDYITNITCTWNPGAQLEAQTTVTVTATSYDVDLFCEMKESEKAGLYVCTLYQDFGITSSQYSITLQTQRLGDQPHTHNCTNFDPTLNIKPLAPVNLSVWTGTPSGSTNLSWATLYNEDSYLTDFLYELHISTRDRSEKPRLIESYQTEVSLLHLGLSPGMEYEARVRAIENDMDYNGQWSDWSSTVRWRTGDKPVPWRSWLPFLFGAITILIIIIFLRFRVHQRMWNKLWILTPNPAPFFKPLFKDHGGNFTSWVNARYPHTMYEVSEKSVMVMEKGDAVQVYDSQAKDKMVELHSSWQALGGPGPWGISYSGGRFGVETPHRGERSYGQVSIDTVTVAEEPGPCCVQCQCHCGSQRDPRPPHSPGPSHSDAHGPPLSPAHDPPHSPAHGPPEAGGRVQDYPALSRLQGLPYGSDQDGNQEPELPTSLLLIGHGRQLPNGRVWGPEDQGLPVAGSEGYGAAWGDTGSWSDRSLDSLSYRSQVEPNPGNLSDPGYPRHHGNLSDPGYPRHHGNLSDPGYPRHQGNLSDPGYPRHHGNLSDPGYPRDLGDAAYPRDLGDLDDPGSPDDLGDPGYPKLLDLDTVDSGFMEIDSDSTSEAEGSGNGGSEVPGDEGQYCRSYIKQQWVTSNSGITSTRSPR